MKADRDRRFEALEADIAWEGFDLSAKFLGKTTPKSRTAREKPAGGGPEYQGLKKSAETEYTPVWLHYSTTSASRSCGCSCCRGGYARGSARCVPGAPMAPRHGRSELGDDGIGLNHGAEDLPEGPTDPSGVRVADRAHGGLNTIRRS